MVIGSNPTARHSQMNARHNWRNCSQLMRMTCRIPHGEKSGLINPEQSPRKFIRRRSTRSAFTLIEMIVATILLFVGVVAAMMCISAATKNTSIASEYTTAALLAQQHLAETEANTDQISPGETQGQFDGENTNFRWQQNIESDSTTPVYKVTLTVTWPSGVNTRSAQFVTFINAPPSASGTTAN